jgi:outer membrane usher protein
MPVINGSAAVPSTVDVFVNNIKAFSQPVEPGPYQIVNLPALAAGGNAQVVVTDASGRQVQSSMPFFAAPTLLAKSLTDFSVEAGFARRNYALLSDDYDNGRSARRPYVAASRIG